MVLSGRVVESLCMHACVYVGGGDKVGVIHLTTGLIPSSPEEDIS